jgi:ubiquinone/menaquinone biosynthesis C-methylase UbiE
MSIQIEEWHAPVECCNPEWEKAYTLFETPEEEQAKFHRRFLRMGVQHWPRDWHVVDVFCGRGNGLVVLERLGFRNLSGIDLSASLLRQYSGSAQLYVADARDLRFAPGTVDAFVVQGGLHHLPKLPDDVEQVLAGFHRCLHPRGRFMLVEPWRTPFLDMVHTISRLRAARRVSVKIDAFARMMEEEAETYFNWLGCPDPLLETLHKHFQPVRQRIAWGKLMFLGTPRMRTGVQSSA